MSVRAAHPLSYERLFHESGLPAFVLPLRDPARADLIDELAAPRLDESRATTPLDSPLTRALPSAHPFLAA
jgi:hypothetical protein